MTRPLTTTPLVPDRSEPVPEPVPDVAPLAPAELRRAFSAFPSGVVLVAARVDGRPAGLLASSFTSVSLDPPLVQVNVAKTSSTWPGMVAADHLGISVLSQGHGHLTASLARASHERFADVELTERTGGALTLPGAGATFVVTRHDEVDAGDHVVVLLRIHDVEHDPSREPVVFHGSRFRRLDD